MFFEFKARGFLCLLRVPFAEYLLALARNDNIVAYKSTVVFFACSVVLICFEKYSDSMIVQRVMILDIFSKPFGNEAYLRTSWTEIWRLVNVQNLWEQDANMPEVRF